MKDKPVDHAVSISIDILKTSSACALFAIYHSIAGLLATRFLIYVMNTELLQPWAVYKQRSLAKHLYLYSFIRINIIIWNRSTISNTFVWQVYPKNWCLPGIPSVGVGELSMPAFFKQCALCTGIFAIHFLLCIHLATMSKIYINIFTYYFITPIHQHEWMWMSKPTN